MGRVILLLAVALWGLGTGAQAAPGCSLMKIAELPVKMSGLRPMVPAKVNGQDALFMADSGAFYSLMSESAAARFGLKRGTTPPGLLVRGVNGAASVQIYTAKDFTLADVPLKNVDFLVGGREVSDEAAGLLGQNILGAADVEYDLANGVIRLFKPKDCPDKANLAYWAGGKVASALVLAPTTLAEPHITASASVNGKPIRVLFDTGASTSVLKLSAAERVGISRDDEAVRGAGIGYGLGRRGVESWISPVDSFAIGQEQVNNTRLRVGDITLDGADMLIGADFFLSHRIYISRTRRRLYFTYNGGPVFKLDRETPVVAAAAPPAKGGEPAPAPADAAELGRRAAAYSARRDFPAAIADLTAAIKLEPTVAQHYYDRAVARLGAQQPIPAMGDLDQALKLKPEDGASRVLRGELLLAGGDTERARADLEAAAKAAPKDAIRLRVAGVYQRADMFEPALVHLDAWIAAALPKHDRLAEAYNARCWTRALWGRQLDLALSDCNAAIKQGLRNSAVLDSRGLVHLRRGELQEAIADYDVALKLQPKSAWSLYGRGLAKQKAGATAAGAGDIAAALALSPDLAKAGKRYGLTDPVVASGG